MEAAPYRWRHTGHKKTLISVPDRTRRGTRTDTTPLEPATTPLLHRTAHCISPGCTQQGWDWVSKGEEGAKSWQCQWGCLFSQRKQGTEASCLWSGEISHPHMMSSEHVVSCRLSVPFGLVVLSSVCPVSVLGPEGSKTRNHPSALGAPACCGGQSTFASCSSFMRSSPSRRSPVAGTFCKSEVHRPQVYCCHPAWPLLLLRLPLR